MKTAISLQNVLFNEAEAFAHRLKKSRSQLYAEALTEYLQRHSPDSITEAMNKVRERLGEYDVSFV
jgi:metal-responsive CopG/Arc/MetJ family transcriptional regulator